jgi:hypothetical protein
LHESVAPVPASRRCPRSDVAITHVIAHRARHPDPAATVGAQVVAALGRLIGGAEVTHRHWILAFEAAQCLGSFASGLAVHRTEYRNLGDVAFDAELFGHGCVHVGLLCCGRELCISRDGRKHSRFDLTEVGANEHMASLGDDCWAHLGRHVV